MQRPINYDRWSTQTLHSSVDAFLSPQQPMVHSISHGGTKIDVLTYDRGAYATLVVFHAALTKRAVSLPQLQGGKLAADTNCNLVAISDPTLLGNNLDLGWYLGNNKTGPLPPVLAPIIQQALDQIGAPRTILMGPSGGGYAAILYGQYFPDSIVLAINPRLDLGAKPASDWGRYLSEAHNANTNVQRIRVRKQYAVVRLREKYMNLGLPFDLCLYQNKQDRAYFRNQTRPFVAALQGDERLHLRTGEDGIGHRPIPGEKLRGIITALSARVSQPEAINQADFSHPTIL